MTSFIKPSSTFARSWSSPERRLFIAVLSQAVHDAFSTHVPKLQKRQARTCLMRNNKDFKAICDHAGRDSQYVFEKIRKKILKANGWNIELSMRVSSPRRRRQMKNYRRSNKHLTGNAYYAARAAKNFYYADMGKKGGRPRMYNKIEGAQ